MSSESAAQDRTVHGLTVHGKEIVRYDRAGHWYVEHDDERLRIYLEHAAHLAAAGTFYPGLPGGMMFDSRVRKVRRGDA